MQTQQIPFDYNLVTEQAQHLSSDSAPLLCRQAAFCGSVDVRGPSEPRQNVNAVDSSQNPSSVTNQPKRHFEESIVTPFNINVEQTPSRLNPILQAIKPQYSSHRALPLPQPPHPLKKSHSAISTQNGQLPGSVKCNKADFVESLVDVAAMIIESIWSNHSASTKTKILPLRVFIRETLQRSRTSFSTLQTALFYLFRVKDLIPRSGVSSTVKDTVHSSTPPMSPFLSTLDFGSDGLNLPPTVIPLPSPPLTPAQAINHGTISQEPHLSTNGKSSNNCGLDPVYCARRMFLASLIIASKFLQDKNYSNKAWAKITGLNSSEINLNEIALLRLIDYRLFISPPLFARWSSMLINYINHSQAAKAANASSGCANGASANEPSITAHDSTKSNAHDLGKQLAQCGINYNQNTSIPFNLTLPSCNILRENIDQSNSQCPSSFSAKAADEVKVRLPSSLVDTSGTKIAINRIKSETYKDATQCLVTSSVSSQTAARYSTHQFSPNSSQCTQELPANKARYIRECISNIRNQQHFSQAMQPKSPNDLARTSQPKSKPLLSCRNKSLSENFPYPTASTRSKVNPNSKSYLNETNLNHYLNHPS